MYSKPPYEITATILKAISAISEKIGEVNARYLNKPSLELRKQNRIKTIHSSLAIEGNTLTESQITAIIEGKRVIGPQKEILEVANAIEVYDQLYSFDPYTTNSFFKAHELLMNGLMANAGSYRKQGVGIVQGESIRHLAPPSDNVPYLMKSLFDYLKKDEDLILIKSCVFHYEMEFIHPFLDGNGRMGRLWQTLILMKDYPVFEYIPFEHLISQTQESYYGALSLSDKSGHSTAFIEYMLKVIDTSLADLLNENHNHLSTVDRLNYFLQSHPNSFTRKEYMTVFKDLSTATASRDLKKGIEIGLLETSGNHNQTVYSKRN
ncbi:MAG: cell filamentation protein Fic [Candidatus Fluviicola riflensis]|nr:MAG: cell filamentation protein Fic [Candidatus Fluviicola riflensis]OGS76926.1 MAG: cell filamentation protein Fic [Candidatus Fluviicola riflensis]OGS81855.1 MAG: cell filamentation protein Fic [Fluviicola sp. RIFCSPHIGHO2_01_FULL_43_53]OGS88654.1 MAG: cell filamentation protein Fic [Fluviicola sp. RIFCSPHIGHO2_12_FULL_43_24]